MCVAEELTDYTMLPDEITGPTVWYCPDMAARGDMWMAGI